VAEKGWLTGLDKQSTREGRTADNVRRKNRGGAPRGGARWKSCAGASQARPGMVSRQSTAYPDEEQRDSTCVTTVPPKWPMTAWGTACGDYFRVTTRKLARPLNTSAFPETYPWCALKINSALLPSRGLRAISGRHQSSLAIHRRAWFRRCLPNRHSDRRRELYSLCCRKSSAVQAHYSSTAA
jgi:hypothetical protein